MSKSEFLNALENALCGLPQADLQKSLDFYTEMIDDRIEDGISEEEAISQIGSIEEIVEQILNDTPITKLVKQKIKPSRRMGVGEILLLVLGSPIWLSLLIATFAVVLAIYIALWAVIIALWACEVAFIGGALGGFASAAIIFATGQNIYAGLMMLAAGLFLVGFSVFFFFVCKWASKGMIWLSRKITLWIKSLFLRKEKAQ